MKQHNGDLSLNSRISEHADAIKGIAMMAIVLYHYFRIALGRPNDIQWTYSEDLLSGFLERLITEPQMSAAIFLQFFGYLGVPVFFILSGWGLAYAQQKSGSAIQYSAFMKQRLLRLMPMYYLSLLGFAALFMISYRNDPLLLSNLLQDVAAKLLLLHNFVPAYTFSLNSVYWFIPTLVTLYLLFPLLYRLQEKHPLTLLASCLLLSYGLSIFLLTDRIHAQYPAWAMGAFPFTRIGEFALGMVIATSSIKTLSGFKLVLLSLFLLTAGFMSFNWPYSYPLHNLLIGAGAICLLIALPRLGQLSPWHQIGVISFPLFLFHRPFIPPWIKAFPSEQGMLLPLLFYLALMLALCTVIQYLHNRILRNFSLGNKVKNV